MPLPRLSIVLPTLNNEALLIDFFERLSQQTYPRAWLELLVLDGGSTDRTVELAKEAGATIIPNPHVLAEPGVNLGLSLAQGEIVMILAADNVFKDDNALEKIVRVFEDSSIYAAFPKHSSNSTDTIFRATTILSPIHSIILCIRVPPMGGLSGVSIARSGTPPSMMCMIMPAAQSSPCWL